MQVERSGGGHEPEHSRSGGATTGEDDTLRELFDDPAGTGHETGTEASPSHPSGPFPEGPAARNQLLRDRPIQIPTARIRRVTVPTVILALVTAGTMGYLAFQSGSTSAAFAAGLLTGFSGLVFGFGEVVDMLTTGN